jgi:hypothetical protein
VGVTPCAIGQYSEMPLATGTVGPRCLGN